MTLLLVLKLKTERKINGQSIEFIHRTFSTLKNIVIHSIFYASEFNAFN